MELDYLDLARPAFSPIYKSPKTLPLDYLDLSAQTYALPPTSKTQSLSKEPSRNPCLPPEIFLLIIGKVVENDIHEWQRYESLKKDKNRIKRPHFKILHGSDPAPWKIHWYPELNFTAATLTRVNKLFRHETLGAMQKAMPVDQEGYEVLFRHQWHYELWRTWQNRVLLVDLSIGCLQLIDRWDQCRRRWLKRQERGRAGCERPPGRSVYFPGAPLKWLERADSGYVGISMALILAKRRRFRRYIRRVKLVNFEAFKKYSALARSNGRPWF